MPPFALAAIVAGCSQDPGEITRDTELFNEIAPGASLSLLGTEPFWGIEIEPDGGGYTATYSSPENIEGTTFDAVRFAGNNGLGFSGELDGQGVQIALTPGECSDAMSDRTYPYFAVVQIGGTDLLGCAYTSDQPFTGDEAP
ncbi:MAG: COG3650 family protein [Erythrobacter sp.]